jgi:hypothetical protein
VIKANISTTLPAKQIIFQEKFLGNLTLSVRIVIASNFHLRENKNMAD